jgi:thiol:disulfide interchange protein
LPVQQFGIVAGVLILIGAVLFLKARQSPAASVEQGAADPTVPPEQAIPTASGSGSSTSAGWATAEAASAGASSATEDLSPEAQLDRLLGASEPVFLFFHSNTCVQCVKMTGIVEDVYPDFSDSVALVDVNVYDERNKSLLQRANIRAIPTLIFVDREREVEGHIGVTEADALRQQLAKMGGE